MPREGEGAAGYLLSPGCVSPWYPMGGRWTGGGQGLWSLPDIGTQALVAFPAGDKRHGIVLGCLYDEKHLPPKTSPENKADSMLLQTRSHRIEITDGAGKEGISIESAAGKMRCVLDKKNGIQIVNGLGDIKINCRKLKTASGKNVELDGKKKVSVSCDGATGTKSGKGTKITCNKNAGMEGKNIKLTGSSGVCAEGKQMAAQDDRVMGMDVHIMVIPSGPGTTTAPLPQPFIGKLNDGLSDDVSIDNMSRRLCSFNCNNINHITSRIEIYAPEKASMTADEKLVLAITLFYAFLLIVLISGQEIRKSLCNIFLFD